MSRRSSRRRFLQQSAVAAVGFWAAGGVTLAGPKRDEELRIAGIGVGGKGHSDIMQAANHGKVVAICDIDESDYGLGRAVKDLEAKGHKPKLYTDYRKMYDEMGKDIDAVTVSTPDHHHAPASIRAMKMGKHVYCQKPLTHTVYEARQMRETAKQMKVATQMGNQGTTENGLRCAVEIIQAGVLGQVKEVHVWTNRPIWPQGAEAILAVGNLREVAIAGLYGKSAEVKTASAPKQVHWDEFLGPAPYRPYDKNYHPFHGAAGGTMGPRAGGHGLPHGEHGIHGAEARFADQLRRRGRAELQSGDVSDRARIGFQFPSRENMGPLKFVWYEGIDNNRNKYLPKLELFHGEKPVGSGSLIVGEKCILYSPDDYGARYKFLGDGAKDVEEAAKKVPESLPRNGKQDDGQKAEWVEAIRNGKPETALSNFDYAAMLTETILLGNVAMRAGQGKVLEWDGPNLRVTNWSDAERYIKGEYRKGWEL